LGRITGGFTHDRLKSTTIKILLFMVSLSSLLLVTGDVAGGTIMLVVILLAGLSYGGMLANLPAQVAEEYGHENFGMVFPLILAAHGITGLFAAPSGGFIYDTFNTYHPALILSGVISAISLICFSAVYKKTLSITLQ